MATKKTVGTKRIQKRVIKKDLSQLRSPKEVAPKQVDGVGTPKNTLPFEIDPKNIESSLEKMKAQLVQWAKKGRYTKVRFKFRGKQLLPDIPLAAVAAVEGATFYWAGILRVLVFNLAGRAVIDVELVNESEKMLAQGKEALLRGDAENAFVLFEKARDMDDENPQVYLNLGIALKLLRKIPQARENLEMAKKLDTQGPVALEASKILESLENAASR
jgi:tetratricopeptide (TPR) repeat protein